jgi:hypothetical protein
MPKTVKLIKEIGKLFNDDGILIAQKAKCHNLQIYGKNPQEHVLHGKSYFGKAYELQMVHRGIADGFVDAFKRTNAASVTRRSAGTSGPFGVGKPDCRTMGCCASGMAFGRGSALFQHVARVAFQTGCAKPAP